MTRTASPRKSPASATACAAAAASTQVSRHRPSVSARSSVCLSVCLSVLLSVLLSVSLPVFLFCLYASCGFFSVCPTACLFLCHHLSVNICLSVCWQRVPPSDLHGKADYTSHLPPVFQTCVLIPVACVSDLRCVPVPRQTPHGKVDYIARTCAWCFRPAVCAGITRSHTCPWYKLFSYLWPMFQTRVLIPMLGVSDLRSHICAQCFRPAFSPMPDVSDLLSHLCPVFQTCVLISVLRCVAGVSDLRSHMCSLCFRPAFSYLCPVFQTCGACRCRVRSRTARWTSCRTTGSERWRATRVRTATRWWGCRPECVRGTRPGTAMSRAVNSTTGCWVSR